MSERRSYREIENLLEETGGCGRYQILLTCTVHLCKTILAFTMLFMVYGAAVPSWWCADDTQGNVSMVRNESTLHQCEYVTNGTSRQCQTFVFDDSMSTVVSKVSNACSEL